MQPFSDIAVIHRPRGEDVPTRTLRELSSSQDAFHFETCLREVLIATVDDIRWTELLPHDEVFRGPEGYAFVLEVICGLRSPLVGETEVLGQFRDAVQGFRRGSTPFGLGFRQMSQQLLEDAKRVRLSHLEELGSQSYGSVIRRELKGVPQSKGAIHIVGAGRLAADCIPWLFKKNAGVQVVVHCRSIERAREHLAPWMNSPEVEIREIGASAFRSEDVNLRALVVAAPVSSEWLCQWMSDRCYPSVVMDLRAESDSDPLPWGDRVHSLSRVFAAVETSRALVEQKKIDAIDMVRECAQARFRAATHRPYGWDDVW